MPKFIPKTPCPNCHKKTWQLTTKASLTFCPHCHTNLYPSKLLNQDKKPKKVMNKKLALFLSCCIGTSVYMSNIFRDELQDNPLFEIFLYTILGFGLLIPIWMLIKAIIDEFRSRELKYQVGIDTLEQVAADSCDYTHTTQQNNITTPHQCESCQSFRLVDMYWFKRILAKNHEEMPVMAKIGDKDRFIGCLHCKTQYKLSNQDSSEIEKRCAIGLGIFLLMLLLASTIFSQFIGNILAFIPEKFSLFWGFFCGLQFYSAFAKREGSLKSVNPLIKVSDGQKDLV